jgi:tRNA(Arg) A34 adenosine deaminase TadA
VTSRRLFLAGLLVGGFAGRRAHAEPLPPKLAALDHARYMRRLLATAAQGTPWNAMLVDSINGEVVLEARNQVATGGPTRHAEMVAIDQYAATGGRLWKQLVLYTTAEPCPMCQGAVEWSGIGAVFFGVSIAFLISKGFSQIDISAAEVARRTPFKQCLVVGGVLENECQELFRKRAAWRDRQK